jgi:hypothetical protein
MRGGLAFWAGIIGAAVMVLGLWIARAIGITEFNLGHFWGSMITGTTTSGSWIVGFIITLILGGLIALLYAAVFEAIGRSSWGWGLLLGVVHLIVAGLALDWISAVHPSIPEVIRNPGYYTANFGPDSVAAFSLLHLIFGIIVGGIYNPVHKRLAVPKGAAERPVALGHEEHEREEVYVPADREREERIPAERSEVKVGRGRRR